MEQVMEADSAIDDPMWYETLLKGLVMHKFKHCTCK